MHLKHDCLLYISYSKGILISYKYVLVDKYYPMVFIVFEQLKCPYAEFSSNNSGEGLVGILLTNRKI